MWSFRLETIFVSNIVDYKNKKKSISTCAYEWSSGYYYLCIGDLQHRCSWMNHGLRFLGFQRLGLLLDRLLVLRYRLMFRNCKNSSKYLIQVSYNPRGKRALFAGKWLLFVLTRICIHRHRCCRFRSVWFQRERRFQLEQQRLRRWEQQKWQLISFWIFF